MDYKTIHYKSGWHEQDIINSKRCGCFHCLAILKPNEIVDWLNENQSSPRGPGKTALCPKCGIDAVLPDNLDRAIDIELLERMNKKYFSLI